MAFALETQSTPVLRASCFSEFRAIKTPLYLEHQIGLALLYLLCAFPSSDSDQVLLSNDKTTLHDKSWDGVRRGISNGGEVVWRLKQVKMQVLKCDFPERLVREMRRHINECLLVSEELSEIVSPVSGSMF